jgi:hypothetical protein
VLGSAFSWTVSSGVVVTPAAAFAVLITEALVAVRGLAFATEVPVSASATANGSATNAFRMFRNMEITPSRV